MSTQKVRRWSDQIAFQSDKVIDHIGHPLLAYIAHAGKLESNIPKDVQDLISDAFGARVAVYSLLLDRDSITRSKQLARLKEFADGAVIHELQNIKRPSTAFHRKLDLHSLNSPYPLSNN